MIMAVVVKLRKAKITTISKLQIAIASFAMAISVWANDFGVKMIENEQGKFYLIETQIEKISPVRDHRVAPLYAKSQLIKYLRKQHPVNQISLSQFILEKKTVTQNKTIFLFKVNAENVKIVRE